MEIKPGVKTSEFWLSIITAIFGIATTCGIFTSAQTGVIFAAISQVAGAIITVVPIFGYAISRGNAKIQR